LEDEEMLSVARVVCDRPIAAGEFHVPHLTLAEVVEHPVVIPKIVIAVPLTAKAREGQDIR